MAINLVKGGRIDLRKTIPTLKNVQFRLGWTPNATSTGTDFDLDATIFGLKNDGNGNGNGKLALVDETWMVFYGNTKSTDGSVVHSGDNLVGGGDGEVIAVALDAVDAVVSELSFVVTIYEAGVRKQNFGQVSNSYIAAFDADTNTEIARYSLDDDFSTETAVQFGSLVRKDGSWVFKAVGTGYNTGLADFVKLYGFDVK